VLSLFSAAAPWTTAASHIGVFKLYTFELDLLSDADLSNLLADLKRRHIALALEWPALTPDGCGSAGIEGFIQTNNGASQGRIYAERIRDRGGSLQYIAFDEPYYFGAFYDGPTACHWTPDKIAQNAAQSVAQIHTVFPDAIVGDIEVVPALSPAPDWLDGYQAWVDAWQRITGTPLAFFHFDVDWGSDWKPAVAALARALKMRHIPVGQIYIGSVDATSDAEWVTSAEQRWTDFETRGSPIPDQVIFQSWESFPKHVLPETDPTTFTHLIDRYYRTRTTLTASADGSTIRGQLTEQRDGSPVATAPITVNAIPLSGTGMQSTYTATGTIPAGTHYVTFGIRAGTECDWPLPAAFSVSQFSLNAGPAGTIVADFTNQLVGWSFSGVPSVMQVNNGNLEVVVNPGELLNLNHDPIPFTAVGAPYTFKVNGTIPVSSAGNACLAAIFQDATPMEFVRVSIPLRPQTISVGATQTTASGSFSVDASSLPPVNLQLWADYTGTDSLWPATASVPIGNAPPLLVATASLPSGTVGTSYSRALAATGGQSPYLWVGIGLPPGLTLHQDGTVTGTPIMRGTYTLSLASIDDSTPTQIVDVSLPLLIN
jgi:hypothetical protein